MLNELLIATNIYENKHFKTNKNEKQNSCDINKRKNNFNCSANTATAFLHLISIFFISQQRLNGSFQFRSNLGIYFIAIPRRYSRMQFKVKVDRERQKRQKWTEEKIEKWFF